ncbi:hypothetical protein LX36DRAFT_285725 [Colletotrichum falcatum]|nr:hypothetical protein LX36DRAFT_285725 [Colletotrichum falcatum]
MHMLNKRNLRSLKLTKGMVRLFVNRVFHDWDTDKPIPTPPDEPPELRLDQCRLRFGNIRPITPFCSWLSVLLWKKPPAHRGQGPPAFLELFLDNLYPFDFGFGFAWTDSQGNYISVYDVDFDDGFEFWSAFRMVQMHHDSNEHKRIMNWNTDRAIYWARQRIYNFARELNGDFTMENGNRHRCADEYHHPLRSARLCRHVIEELFGNRARRPWLCQSLELTAWAWVDLRSAIGIAGVHE